MKVILEATRTVLANETRPIDAYRIARMTKHSVMDCGRALQELVRAGEALGLGDGGDNPLAEAYESLPCA